MLKEKKESQEKPKTHGHGFHHHRQSWKICVKCDRGRGVKEKTKSDGRAYLDHNSNSNR